MAEQRRDGPRGVTGNTGGEKRGVFLRKLLLLPFSRNHIHSLSPPPPLPLVESRFMSEAVQLKTAEAQSRRTGSSQAAFPSQPLLRPFLSRRPKKTQKTPQGSTWRSCRNHNWFKRKTGFSDYFAATEHQMWTDGSSKHIWVFSLSCQGWFLSAAVSMALLPTGYIRTCVTFWIFSRSVC